MLVTKRWKLSAAILPIYPTEPAINHPNPEEAIQFTDHLGDSLMLEKNSDGPALLGKSLVADRCLYVSEEALLTTITIDYV